MMTLCLSTATHNFKVVKIICIFVQFQTNICKSECLNTDFIPNDSDSIG